MPTITIPLARPRPAVTRWAGRIGAAVLSVLVCGQSTAAVWWTVSEVAARR